VLFAIEFFLRIAGQANYRLLQTRAGLIR